MRPLWWRPKGDLRPYPDRSVLGRCRRKPGLCRLKLWPEFAKSLFVVRGWSIHLFSERACRKRQGDSGCKPIGEVQLKRALSIIGGLFLAFVVLVAGLLGYSAYQGPGLDASSKAYVEENVPAILSSWSKDELLKR